MSPRYGSPRRQRKVLVTVRSQAVLYPIPRLRKEFQECLAERVPPYAANWVPLRPAQETLSQARWAPLQSEVPVRVRAALRARLARHCAAALTLAAQRECAVRQSQTARCAEPPALAAQAQPAESLAAQG